MDNSEKVEFSVTISAMLETFGQEATTPRLMGYWLGLQDLELPDVQRAVARALRGCKSMPSAAEIRELAGELNPESAAVMAWADVLKALPLGPYKHVDFEDRVCNAAIRSLGGWPSFIERFSDAESEKWLRIEFIRAYKSYAGFDCLGEIGKPLAGLAEVTVSSGKLIPYVPVKIAATNQRLLDSNVKKELVRI